MDHSSSPRALGIPPRRRFSSCCLGQFWKAEVGQFSRAPKGAATGQGDAHRHASCPCPLAVAANRPANPPTAPAARRRLDRATDSYCPSPPRPELSSSKSRRLGFLVLSSKRGASCPPGVQPRESRE